MSGGRGGIPNKKSLIARAEMERLGINPIEMLKRVYDTAMEDYKKGRGITEKGDSGAQWLAVARSAASDLAAFKHPKLSAIAVKDVTSEESIGATSMTTQEARKVLEMDPIAQVPTSSVIEQMTNPIETPALPKGEGDNV